MANKMFLEHRGGGENTVDNSYALLPFKQRLVLPDSVSFIFYFYLPLRLTPLWVSFFYIEKKFDTQKYIFIRDTV